MIRKKFKKIILSDLNSFDYVIIYGLFLLKLVAKTIIL